jgi:8-oxo-dGTP diphosphatase
MLPQAHPYQDRTAHYFLVSVEVGPMNVGGPEALVQSDENRYIPEWVSMEQLAEENLKPETVQDLLSGLLPSQPPALS